MKSSVKRTVSVFLAVLMVFSLAVTSLAAAKNQKYKDNPDGKSQMITGYNASGDEEGLLALEAKLELTIGDGQVFSLKFTSVAANAFNAELATLSNKEKDFLNTVTEITVEEGIANIGENAFANLPALKKVTFSGNVTLKEGAFSGCKALKKVVFEKGSNIGANVFDGCSALTNISFGADAVLDETAFEGATALSEIETAEGVKLAGGANALKNSAFVKNCPVDFVMMGSTLVYYKGNDEAVTIPLNVTAIGDSAFAGNKHLRKVVITKYVDTLGDNAFSGCKNLDTVEFSSYGELKSIGKDVFTDTPYFDDFEGDFFTIGSVLIKYVGEDSIVYIPNTVTAIADECFMDRYASKNPDGYTWVVSGIFVPASVKSIGENCFALARLENGTYYTPKIYAYNGTKAMELIKAAGLDVTANPMIGDVDGDGAVKPADARLALRMAVKLDTQTDPRYVKAADVNSDNSVTAADARTILRLAVGLESYTAEDLLLMPGTNLEILMAYANAIDNAVLHGAGYTKTVTNTEAGHDMCPAAIANFYKDLSNKGYTNETKTYAPNTNDAIENLDTCELVSDKNIESASCVFENGKYTVTIKFKDILDNKGTSDITKIFPVKTINYYTDAYKGQSWWNGTRESNSLTRFDLTYTNPTITAVFDKETNEIQELKLSVGYHFDIDGRINGLAISSHMWEQGCATFDRLDVITYSNFTYNPIISE